MHVPSRGMGKKILRDNKLTELLISIRHYSTLRFAILTVYFAVSGGLLVKFFDCDFSRHYPELLWLFQFAGGTVTITFFIYEIVLDDNLRRLWKSIAAIVRKKEDVLLSHRQSWKNFLVPVATYGIFIGALVFWLCAAQYYYPCKDLKVGGDIHAGVKEICSTTSSLMPALRHSSGQRMANCFSSTCFN